MGARRAGRTETTLATLYRSSPIDATSEPAVFGSRVVKQTLLREIVRHSAMDRGVFLASPFDEPQLSRSMAELVANGASMRQVIVQSTTSLLADASWLSRLTAWHEVDEQAHFAAELRSARATRAFPITTTCHAFGYREQLHDLYTRMLLLDLRPYDAHVCTSRGARTAFRRILDRVTDQLNDAHGTRFGYPGRLETIPLGVDTARFRPGDRARMRDRLGLPGDAVVLLCFGRISFVDKADLFPLIGVFRDLVRERRRRRLLLVVAGSSIAGAADMLERHCRDLGVSDRVRILSPFPDPDRQDLFAAADVFVSPGDSIQEAFGQTPLEAMACGVPQVVSDWDGYRDTVVEGETGFLVPTYWARCDRDVERTPLLDWDLLDHAVLGQSLVVDVARLRTALATLIDDASLRERLGRGSRERAVEHFGWDAIVRRYDALWRDLAAEAAASTDGGGPRRGTRRVSRFDAFRGYATAILDDSTRVRLTAQGRLVLEGAEPMPAYFVSAAGALSVEALAEALALLGQRRATLGSVARAIARPGWHGDHARRHVLWHLKQGFAEPIRSRARRGT